MADRFPLIANSSANQIQELAASDNLNLANNSIVGVVSVTATTYYGNGANLTGIDASSLKDGNNVKVQATSTGATVTGNLLPEADNTRDLGSTSKRWANLYVGDMHYSNEGSSNNVDGTWGSYTIQEGQNDLFLINNRNGKKYKFNLTEVV
jgi:hypothetical protein|tara:strand:+ start:50 stop:502 length:453 start_codon:yes stop_codon:yes gene_type:complete